MITSGRGKVVSLDQGHGLGEVRHFPDACTVALRFS